MFQNETFLKYPRNKIINLSYKKIPERNRKDTKILINGQPFKCIFIILLISGLAFKLVKSIFEIVNNDNPAIIKSIIAHTPYINKKIVWFDISIIVMGIIIRLMK